MEQQPSQKLQQGEVGARKRTDIVVVSLQCITCSEYHKLQCKQVEQVPQHACTCIHM